MSLEQELVIDKRKKRFLTVRGFVHPGPQFGELVAYKQLTLTACMVCSTQRRPSDCNCSVLLYVVFCALGQFRWMT